MGSNLKSTTRQAATRPAPATPAAASAVAKTTAQPTAKTSANTKAVGDAAESAALAYLRAAGLSLLVRNYRTPGRGGGEIDLIMRAGDGTCVFVEVRARAGASHGGAAASVSATKRRRIIFAAQSYLARFKTWPPCRFDVIAVQGGSESPGGERIDWIEGAFDAGG